MGTFTIVTQPTEFPVTLDEAKDHLRITDTDNDARIRSLITTATNYVELYIGRVFITQTWDMWLDEFQSVIPIIKPPLQSVTSISYVDTSGDTQTISSSPITTYDVDTDSIPGRVFLAYNESWPNTRAIKKAVKIRFIAGYGTAEDVPEPIKQAILLMISHWYEIREPIIFGIPQIVPYSVESLMSQYRLWTL
jgi:uncharacterized phiE125 gp8 family phage protein